MPKKRIVLKMSSSNSKKSQQKILRAVTKIEGVEKLEMDGHKGTLTVVGDVEPVPIFKALKKIGETPEIVTVGPPRPQRCEPYCYCGSCQSYSYSDQQQKWRDPLKLSCPLPCNRSWCNQCELVAVEYPPAYDSGQCSIQ
ncbi:heavy metal-associated isoprenylated plant protein 39-like [Amaranthus tricolor]|uniref:heavy metal-associated isoprenylated plant protein 39-like n=1 Tax=Amaranthus tricolor TaxID=29722 RepID=UPI002585A7FD|nr:heavy metal-associated isoprenylated plant protein 39-like [Amaranthus tricolor]